MYEGGHLCLCDTLPQNADIHLHVLMHTSSLSVFVSITLRRMSPWFKEQNAIKKNVYVRNMLVAWFVI